MYSFLKHIKMNLMKTLVTLSTLIIGSLMLLAVFSPALALTNPIIMPGMEALSSNGGARYSTNWGGYAVGGSEGSVTSVSGSWIVPAVRGAIGTTPNVAAFWTGIDGFNSPTVEQIGTISASELSFVQEGRFVFPVVSYAYFAWYEFYPSQPAIIPITTATSPSGAPATVNPGDTISANVKYNGGSSFTITLTDVTAGWTFSYTGSAPGAEESSAEWIAEAPSSNTGILPLANFGIAKYGEDFTTVASTCYATVNGLSESIADSPNVQSITMATLFAIKLFHSTIVIPIPKATPSALSPDGTSFFIVWNSYG